MNEMRTTSDGTYTSGHFRVDDLRQSHPLTRGRPFAIQVAAHGAAKDRKGRLICAIKR